MKNLLPVLLGSLLFIFALSVLPHAQIGEVAGPLNFNVSVGSEQSLTLTIINGGSETISYMATPTITTAIPNSTTPQVSITPMNESIPPHSQLGLTVTVYIPRSKNRPGMVWNGYISTVELSNTTVVGGVDIQTGVLKMMTITAAQPRFQPIYLLIAALSVASVGIGSYYAVSRLRAKRAAAKKVRKRARAT